MKLSKLSLIFPATLLIVSINGVDLLSRPVGLQPRPGGAGKPLAALSQWTICAAKWTPDALGAGYAVTGEIRYHAYYYAILAIRDWCAAGRCRQRAHWDPSPGSPFVPRSGRLRMSLRARMIALGFDGDDLAAFDGVLAEAEALKAIEQVAPCRHQGLYDPLTGNFVTAGVPRPELAVRLVHARDYDIRRARQAGAVAELKLAGGRAYPGRRG